MSSTLSLMSCRWIFTSSFSRTVLRNCERRRISLNTTIRSSVPTGNQSGDVPKKTGLVARLKSMYKDYWYVTLPVHVVTSCIWFGSFYQVSRSGVDIGAYMKKMGFSDSALQKFAESEAGHLAVAFALYKIASPVRYAATLGATTVAITRLKRMGYIKPAKQIISQGKDQIISSGKNLLKGKPPKSS